MVMTFVVVVYMGCAGCVLGSNSVAEVTTTADETIPHVSGNVFQYRFTVAPDEVVRRCGSGRDWIYRLRGSLMHTRRVEGRRGVRPPREETRVASRGVENRGTMENELREKAS
jgi:hypothetical protein